MFKLASIIWNSPTLMTWGSLLTRSTSLIVVLPLILTRFSVEEISLWYLFSIIIGFQMIVDAGFSPTFSRVISYAMGGCSVEGLRRPAGTNNGRPNWNTLGMICSTMHVIYSRLSVIWFFLLVFLGSFAVGKPISIAPDAISAWIAWGIIIVVSCITLRGNIYSAYLQGLNKIALLRRWEIMTSLGAIITSVLVLLGGGGLLALVSTHQSWQIINVLRNRWLSGAVEGGFIKTFSRYEQKKGVFDAVWPSAWRSGFGVFMTYGLVQASGVLYAQVGSASSVASYLLGLRLIQTVSQFSQAPFYSKVPTFVRLFAQGEKYKIVELAKRGMGLAYWSYVAGFVGLGIAGEPLLKYIGSNADFPSFILWSLLGTAFFVERYGAMHIQLYSVTNHIIWHIANGISGIIYLVVSISLFNVLGVYAFPIGVLAGYLTFYSWYAAKHSYSTFGISFFSFERDVLFAPMVIMGFYVALEFLLN